MPQLTDLHFSTTQVGFWRIEEDESSLIHSLPPNQESDSLLPIKKPEKRLQWLAVRNLAANMGIGTIHKNELGAPILSSGFCSVSHCGNLVAIAFNPTQPTGIDLELNDEQCYRLKSKFISPEEAEIIGEITPSVARQIWSAKEAVYKWDGGKRLDFRMHLPVRAYSPQELSVSCIRESKSTSLQILLSEVYGMPFALVK